MTLWRPVIAGDPAQTTLPVLAGGWARIAGVERLGGPVLPLSAAPSAVIHALTADRAALCGLTLDRPRIMGILNVTPDSFSDGGRFDDPGAAVAAALRMVAEGADIIDIGGESTRPGAEVVSVADEIARVVPVIRALRPQSAVPISIDTRKAAVVAAAVEAGASMVNDVSALTWDPDMAATVARAEVPLCLMHAQGTPQTMQADPRYGDVLADVYGHLSGRIQVALDAGIDKNRLLVDPGIGFGKTVDHNLTLLRRISLFHSLGVPLLLGVSRKRFIGVIGNGADVGERLPGSLAVALHAIQQGVQIIRVHDTKATKQAIDLWRAVTGAGT
jgi:dihydropteroate synthase